MDDFNFWWYIIAAVIYFLTRGRKKKQAKPSRPGSESTPPVNRQPKSFEDLLREITAGNAETEVEEPEQEPIDDKPTREAERKRSFEQEGRRRTFADEESKRVYEESIKMAEGADIDFAPADQFKSGRLFGEKSEETDRSFAKELMDGFDANEARKAVIYSEIFNRKY